MNAVLDGDEYFAELASQQRRYTQAEYGWAVIYGALAAAMAIRLRGWVRARFAHRERSDA